MNGRTGTYKASFLKAAFASAIVAIAAQTQVRAEALYGAYVDANNGQSLGLDVNTGPVGVTASLTAEDGLLQGTARAGPTLGTFSSAVSDGIPGSVTLIRSGAGVEIHDAFVGGSTATVEAPLNLLLEGAMGILVPTNPIGAFNSYSNLFLQVSVKPAGGTPTTIFSIHQVSAGQYGDALLHDGRSNYGFLEAAPWVSSFAWDSIAAIISTDFLTLPVNQLFELDINLTTYVQDLNTSLITPVTAVADFLNTLGFAADFPVFGLPAGYTFDAPSVGIVNNRCTIECLTLASPVPEPDSLWLLLSGLCILAGRSSRWLNRAVLNGRRTVALQGAT